MTTPTAYLWKTIRLDAFGNGYEVHGFSAYPSGVLQGQTGKFFLNHYSTVADALAEHPDLKRDGEIRWGSKWTDPQVPLNHLSDGPDDDY